MAAPNANDTIAPSPKPRSKTALVWMILSQVVSVLLILGTVALGFFLSLLGSSWIFLILALIIAILLIIPIVFSWKMYKKGNVKTSVVLTTIPFLLMVCPWTVAAVFYNLQYI
jgi:hypothetical protein